MVKTNIYGSVFESCHRCLFYLSTCFSGHVYLKKNSIVILIEFNEIKYLFEYLTQFSKSDKNKATRNCKENSGDSTAWPNN